MLKKCDIMLYDLSHLVEIVCFYYSFYGMTLNSDQFKGRGYIFKSIIVCHY